MATDTVGIQLKVSLGLRDIIHDTAHEHRVSMNRLLHELITFGLLDLAMIDSGAKAQIDAVRRLQTSLKRKKKD